MSHEEILKSIVVQGTVIDADTSEYRKIILSGDKEGQDPFIRTVNLIVKMCEDGEMDPWNVSIRSIAAVVQKMISENSRNFSQAGLVMMNAWHLLFVKTENLIGEMSTVREQFPDSMQEQLFPDFEFGSSDDTVQSGIPAPVENVETAPLEPLVRHERSKIMLVEILEAIRNAYLSQKKIKSFQEIPKVTGDMSSILSEMHPEQPEMEIEQIWLRILSNENEMMRMESIWGDVDFERKKFLVYSMFLGRQKKITMSQESAGGDIWIQKIQNQ